MRSADNDDYLSHSQFQCRFAAFDADADPNADQSRICPLFSIFKLARRPAIARVLQRLL
jgi:hypothetical protein